MVSWERGLIHSVGSGEHLRVPRVRITYSPPFLVLEFMGNSNKKKAQQLGMPWGTATHRLRQRLFFSLLVKLGENVCFKCGQRIETVDELSIDHKQDWLDVDPQLFWAEDNCAYSHRRCNKASRRIGKTGRHGTHGLYTEGCRCRECTDAHVAYNNQWRYRKGLRTERLGIGKPTRLENG